jgi:hypothetical protein
MAGRLLAERLVGGNFAETERWTPENVGPIANEGKGMEEERAGLYKNRKFPAMRI